MHNRSLPHTTLALLVAGGGLLIAWFATGPGWPSAVPLDAAGAPHRPAPPPAARQAIERCQENVTMVNDVAWAAACKAVADEAAARRAACLLSRPGPGGADACLADGEPDDSPDCTLPDDRAKALNTARSAADAQCVAESLAGQTSP